MCTLIVGWRLFPNTPLVVAANRDELLERPSDPPLLLTDLPPRWGGRDRLAGGTWLAVDPDGRIGAVTNRHPGGRPPARDSSRRSRGALPLAVLAGDDSDARDWAASLEPTSYNPVNVLYASPTAAWVVSLDDDTGNRFVPLEPGVHVLTEQDVDDPLDPKTQEVLATARAAAEGCGTAAELVTGWREVLRSHETADGWSAVCVHGEVHGTVSSATVTVSAGPAQPGQSHVRYEHAEGPPCRTPYRPVLGVPE